MVLLEENHFIPYMSNRLPGKRVLVLAPHPDDETFGCGGSLIQHTDTGEQVKVVFLTNGAKGSSRERDKNNYISLRRMEAEKACWYLAVTDLEFWPYEDRSLDEMQEVISKILKLIQTFKPEIIYVPSPFEIHPDHRATTFFFEKAARKSPFLFKIVLYEIGQPLPAVNLLVDITSVLQRKKKAVSAYESQLQERPYGEFCISLNRFRSFTLSPAYTHAEAFFTFDSVEIKHSNLKEIILDNLNDRFIEPEYKKNSFFQK